MPRKAKRKSEVEKPNSKTPTEENVSVKRKAVEKKTSESECTIPEDTVQMCSTLSGIAVESFVSKSAVPKIIPKCIVHKNAPKGTPPRYALEATVSKNSRKDELSKKVPKITISRVFVPENSETSATVKSSKAKSIVPKDTDTKKIISKGTDLQMVAPRGSDLNVFLPKCAAQNNSESIFSKPKPVPLQVTTLKCTSRGAARQKEISPPVSLKRCGFKNQATKITKKPALKKTASKSININSGAVKISSVKTNKNTGNNTDKAIPKTSIARRMLPRRSAAIKADEKMIALQQKKSVDKAKKKKSGRGRALIYKPLSIKAFKKIMSKIHLRIKPVIQQLLQMFCEPKFLLDGHKRYTHYKSLQYELERWYGFVLRIFTRLSKVLPRLEGRNRRWLKKHNLPIPKTMGREKKVSWTYPPQPSKKLVGVLPIIQKKPNVRRRRPQPARLQGEALEFWTYMEHFVGNIVPLMKLSNNVRRDIRKTRHISNEENYEELKVMQSTVVENEYAMIPFLNKYTTMTPHAKAILNQEEKDKEAILQTEDLPKPDLLQLLKIQSNVGSRMGEKISKDTHSPEVLRQLTSMLNSLKSVCGKNSQWFQELFKWVEIEIEKQHVQKLLFSNDEIVTQICDEILEILYYEKSLTENQRKKVSEYIKIRRKHLSSLHTFCKERKNLLPEKHEQNRCTSSSSSLCRECRVTKKETPGTYRIVCL